MPALLVVNVISPTWPYLEKKAPSQSSVRSMRAPSNITLVLRVPMYSVWGRMLFVVKMLPVNCFVFSSVAIMMFYMAFNL